MVFRFSFALALVIALCAWSVEPAHAVIRVVGSQSATIAWDGAPGQVSGYDVYTSVNQRGETLQAKVGIDEPFVLNASFGDSVIVRVRPFDASGDFGPVSDPSESISFIDQATADADAERTGMDFNGDARGDILIQNFESRELEVWMMDGEIVESSASLPDHLDQSWSVASAGDLNGDGMADLVWRQDSGDMIVWLNDNGRVIDSLWYEGAGPDWKIIGTADLNGDGNDDLIFADDDTHRQATWLMDGVSVIGNGLIRSADVATRTDGTWTLAATPDLNGDGNADILWRLPDGHVLAWMMDGRTVLDKKYLMSPPLNWSIVGSPDLDGDGVDELLWRHETGILYSWFMNGTSVSQHTQLPDPGLEWTIVGMRDFDGDGRDDMLWQHDVGLLYTFMMDGKTLIDHGMVGSPGAGFDVVE